MPHPDDFRMPTGGGPLQTMKFLAHLPNFFRLYWRLFRDPRVGLLAKAVLVAGIAYLIIPTDLLTEWGLPGIGLIDDLVVVGLAMKSFVWLSPRQVVEEHVRLIDQGG